MDPIKAIGRMGMLGNFLNQFDGGVEILDDLDDHWTARNHKDERNWFIQELQDLAADKSIRITILGWVSRILVCHASLNYSEQRRCPPSSRGPILFKSQAQDSQRPRSSIYAQCDLICDRQYAATRNDGRHTEQA